MESNETTLKYDGKIISEMDPWSQQKNFTYNCQVSNIRRTLVDN